MEQLDARATARLSRLITIGFYAVVLGLFYVFVRYAFWLVFPFLFAFVVAALLQPPVNFAHKKLKLRKGLAAVVFTLLFYVAIVLVVVLVGVRLYQAIYDFRDYITVQIKGLPNVIEDIAKRVSELAVYLPQSTEDRVNAWIQNFLAGKNAQGETVGMLSSLLSRVKLEWFKTPLSGVLQTAGKIPSIVMAVVITVVSSFFMTGSYSDIVHFIKQQLPPARQHALSSIKRMVVASLLRLLRSYVIIIGVTFGELLLGFFVLQLVGVFDGRYMVGLAIATAVVDILPVLGTGSVLIPWALYHLIMGNIGMGVGVLVIYAVIQVVRQILEPKLVASNLGLPPIVTIAGMYIGLQVFGFVGMLIVPLMLILLKLLGDEGLVQFWRGKHPVVAATQPEPKPPAKPAQ